MKKLLFSLLCASIADNLQAETAPNPRIAQLEAEIKARADKLKEMVRKDLEEQQKMQAELDALKLKEAAATKK